MILKQIQLIYFSHKKKEASSNLAFQYCTFPNMLYYALQDRIQ